LYAKTAAMAIVAQKAIGLIYPRMNKINAKITAMMNAIPETFNLFIIGGNEAFYIFFTKKFIYLKIYNTVLGE